MMQADAPKHQAFHTHETPHCFTLAFDCTKLKSKNAWSRAHFAQRQTLYGVIWPPSDGNPQGGLSLSNAVSFRTLDELRDHFAEMGQATLTWLDTGDMEEIG